MIFNVPTDLPPNGCEGAIHIILGRINMNNEKRDRSLVFIAKNLTNSQASRLFAEVLSAKEKYAPDGRGTIRKERYDSYLSGARHKGTKRING